MLLRLFIATPIFGKDKEVSVSYYIGPMAHLPCSGRNYNRGNVRSPTRLTNILGGGALVTANPFESFNSPRFKSWGNCIFPKKFMAFVLGRQIRAQGRRASWPLIRKLRM